MKKCMIIIPFIFLVSVMLLSPSCLANETETDDSSITLSEQQSNAINMLNYLRALAQEIRSSSSSKVYLEEAYSELDNNTNPSAVDAESLREVMNLLDDLESFRMTEVKRERLQYLYEQKQAQNIRAAIPNPLGLLSLSRARTLPRLLLSSVYMAVDSVTSYQAATADTDMEYLEKGWELDDEGAKTLHKNITELYSYMVNMVNLYDLDGSLALNNEAVEDYVFWKGNDNLQRQIQFFESKEDTYRAFGPYWLTLSSYYYDNGDYQKCLDCIAEYEKLDIRIFRKDYDYAQALTKAIAASDEVFDDNDYVRRTSTYCKLILDNTIDEQWELKYFVAETYVDLYNRTGDISFLQEAYDTTLNNVNYLVDEQKQLNYQYLMDVVEVKASSDSTKSQKEEVKQYNKMLKSTRKVELPPIYNPLLVNVDLLYTLSNELNIDEKEQSRVDMMVHGADGILFLVSPINNLYTFGEKEPLSADDLDLSFYGDRLEIPAEYVSDTAEILVKVSEAEDSAFRDWVVAEVKREEDSDISSFKAIYESDMADDYEYKDGDIIKVSIVSASNSEIKPITCKFKAVRKKAVPGLDTWDWLDDISEWSDHFDFERITGE